MHRRYENPDTFFMRSLILLPALVIFILIACNSRRHKSSFLTPVNSQNKAYAGYDEIIRSFSKNYVLIVARARGEFRRDRLAIFGKTEEQLARDSMEYQNAVTKFYNADTSILSYLLTYKLAGNPWCNWIATQDPFSSIIPRWRFGFSESKGAAILMYDYLSYVPSTRPPIAPADMETIAERYTITLFESWLKENAGLPLNELRQRFRNDSSYFRPKQYQVRHSIPSVAAP